MAPRKRRTLWTLTHSKSIVVEALDTLPPEFARYLENVEIRIEPAPDARAPPRVGLKPWQTLYGLYQGVPLTVRSSSAPLMPDLITLFQEPLERDFPGHRATARAGAPNIAARDRALLWN